MNNKATIHQDAEGDWIVTDSSGQFVTLYEDEDNAQQHANELNGGVDPKFASGL